MAKADENQSQPKGGQPALLGTIKDRGLIRPDDMREKIQPLYNRCKHEVEKRGRCKRENEDKFNKQLRAIQGTFSQAFSELPSSCKLIGSRTVYHTATVHTATVNCLSQMIQSPVKPQNLHQC